MHDLDPALGGWVARQLSVLGQPPDFDVTPLRAEASHRQFYRVRTPDTAWVVMSSPPALENNGQFETLARVFASNGVAVPKIQARQPEAGWYLMTDLGERHLADVYGSAHEDTAMGHALDTLVRIQAIDDPAVPPYTAQRFRDELDIFQDWFVAGWLCEDFPHAALQPVFEALIENTQTQIQVCVHRDYHSRNLLFGEGALGVVDFQDALKGPVSYDLASLLRDCYHRFSEHTIALWRGRYLELTPLPLDPARFAVDLDLTAAQRLLKAVGIFARLEQRDGKASHLEYIPPTLDHLLDLARRHAPLGPLQPHLTRWRGAAATRLGSK